MSNDEYLYLYQTEGEVSSNEEYRQARDAVAELTGGLVIEGTDGPEAMAVSMFQPADVAGVTVTVAGRGVQMNDGTTEHSDVVVEDYTQPVPGAELRADKRLFAKR